MNSRSGVVTFLLFTALSTIIFFQILSMRQSDRFYKRLEELGKNYQVTTTENAAGQQQMKKYTGQEYPGDDGDWLVWVMHVEPRTLNNISVDRDTYTVWITTPNIFEPLLNYNFDTVKLEPWLAESYKVSDDGLEISFTLRDDVYFSDGVKVTSDDVIFTYQTIMDPKVDAANLANQFIDVQKAVKVDERTVKFVMKQPYFKALENLSFYQIGILPKHIYQYKSAEEFNRHRSNPVGSGPYIFEKWDVGNQVVFRRNENYWGAKPNLEKVIYKFIPNTIASLQALRAGQVDMTIPELDQYYDVEREPGFKDKFYCLDYWMPGSPFFYIGWNQQREFFKNRKVRLAMTHMINRRGIIENFLKGYGKEITGPFYIYGKQNDPNIQPWPFDLEKAGQLLDEAGWIDHDGDGIRDKDGVKFRFKFMYAIETTLYERISKLLKDDAAKIGVEVILEPYEWSIVISRLNERDFDAFIMGWGGDILEDQYELWHSSQRLNRGSNYVGFNIQQADRIIEEARRTMDEQKRNKLYFELHRLLHEEQPYTFLFAKPTFRLADKRYENVKIHKLGLNYLEWYVPKEKQKYR